jgi:hypothetical protein
MTAPETDLPIRRSETPDGPVWPYATRVRKARRAGGVCPACGTVIITGQQIGKVTGRGWLHVACIIRRQPMIGPHSGA